MVREPPGPRALHEQLHRVGVHPDRVVERLLDPARAVGPEQHRAKAKAFARGRGSPLRGKRARGCGRARLTGRQAVFFRAARRCFASPRRIRSPAAKTGCARLSLAALVARAAARPSSNSISFLACLFASVWRRSPTGFLHIGNVRTALFNWLFARHHGGEFRLRIENTDTSREVAEATEQIQESLRWLGLDWDGDVTFQLDRMGDCAEVARRLVEEGKAYEDEGAIRFRMPDEGVTAWDDAVRGHVEFPNEKLEDLVLVRSDGRPTYNFASPMEDVWDGITHVIRGRGPHLEHAEADQPDPCGRSGAAGVRPRLARARRRR